MTTHGTVTVVDHRTSWLDLATYNAEKARGIVHSDEWSEKMAAQQQEYNAVVSAQLNKKVAE